MAKMFVQVLVLSVMLSSSLFATPTYNFVYSYQAGAQTQIDLNHSSTWTFNLTGGSFDLGGGKLVMKDGSQTNSTITLAVWQGFVGNGSALASVTLTDAQFGANHVGNSQTFDTTTFLFSSPITLSAVNTYVVELSSGAPDSQNFAYFIKGGGSGTFLDSSNNPPPDVTINGGTQTGGQVVAPEPTTLGLAGIGAALMCLGRVRRMVVKR